MKKHFSHYLPLIAILVMGFIGFYLSPYDRSFQSSIVIATGVGYLTWGLIHHFIHKDLHLSIILEYLVITLFGVVSLLALLFRT